MVRTSNFLTTFILLFSEYKLNCKELCSYTTTSMLISATISGATPNGGVGGERSGEMSRSMYNHQANNWTRNTPRCLSDFTGRPVVFEMMKPHIMIVEGVETDTDPGTVVLDVGCGEGYCARKVVEMGAELVVGSDISEAMVQCAAAAAENADGSNDNSKSNDSGNKQKKSLHYYCASSCNLLEGLERERKIIQYIPEAFDVAMAVFLFNYLTTDEMLLTMTQIHSALKPGGIFVFSVPHPSMIYCHEKDAIFRLESNGKGYFSAVNEKLLGHISTVDGTRLNIMSIHKTMNDYIGAIRDVGFEILDIREAGVKEEHMKLNPTFFSSVNDRPLHLVFKLQKKV